MLALDVDTMPGLAFSLGLSPDRVGDAGMPEDLAERVPEKGWVLKEGVEVAALVQAHALIAPDGVRFLQLGKLPNRVKPGSTVAFRAVMEDFREEGWTLIGDLAAGTRQPFFGWSDFAEAILLVVEPSAKSTLSARRLAKLAYKTVSADQTDKLNLVKRTPLGIVANKVRSAEDVRRIEQALSGYNLPLLASIPYDPQLAQAEQDYHAPIDVAPNSPAVLALRELAERLEQWVDERPQIRRTL